MCIDASGYVHAFGGIHNGDMQYASTSAVSDPSTFVTPTAIAPKVSNQGAGFGFTYPHPIFIADKLYVFKRRCVTASSGVAVA